MLRIIYKNDFLPVKLKFSTMRKYECKACGWIYDETIGDPDGGIPSCNPFDELGPTWVCPGCGLGKEAFEEVF